MDVSMGYYQLPYDDDASTSSQEDSSDDDSESDDLPELLERGYESSDDECEDEDEESYAIIQNKNEDIAQVVIDLCDEGEDEQTDILGEGHLPICIRNRNDESWVVLPMVLQL